MKENSEKRIVFFFFSKYFLLYIECPSFFGLWTIFKTLNWYFKIISLFFFIFFFSRIVPETCRQDLGVTQVHPHLTKGQACGIELILTFILIFTIFATIDPNRKELGSKPLAIGLTVSMCHLVGVSINFTHTHTHTHIYIYIYIVVGNGHGDTSSNPGRNWLHFT